MPNVSYCVQENEVHYNPIDYSLLYLTFVALEDGTFEFKKSGGGDIQYSLDNGSTWTSLASNVSTPIVTAGSKILWKGNLIPNYYDYAGTGTFSSTGQFNVEGNPLSTLKGDDFKVDTSLIGFDFERLFKNCTKLINAKNLSLKTISGCACDEMFYGCTALETAPELPATTLDIQCYRRMFYQCRKLNYIKCLATDISARDCTFDWVTNVASSGTFVKSPDISEETWGRGTSGIPNGWTVEDA